MKKQVFKKITWRPIGVFLVAVLLTGCTAIPVGKYDALAESSQNILSGTSDTYTRIEKLQRRFLVETVSSQSINKDSFKPIIDGQSFDITPELNFREAALQVLVKYSVVLQAFAKRDFEGEVDKAAIELAGSLKSLAATTAPNNDSAKKASGILATVVDVIGQEIVRQKRLEALKTVMDKAQPDLDKLANLIAGSNEKIDKAINKMLERILAHRNEIRPDGKSLARTQFDSDTALLIAEIEGINAALNDLSGAMKKFPPAHADIRTQLENKPNGMEALQQLVQEAQKVDKFYRSVK